MRLGRSARNDRGPPHLQHSVFVEIRTMPNGCGEVGGNWCWLSSCIRDWSFTKASELSSRRFSNRTRAWAGVMVFRLPLCPIPNCTAISHSWGQSGGRCATANRILLSTDTSLMTLLSCPSKCDIVPGSNTRSYCRVQSSNDRCLLAHYLDQLDKHYLTSLW